MRSEAPLGDTRVAPLRRYSDHLHRAWSAISDRVNDRQVLGNSIDTSNHGYVGGGRRGIGPAERQLCLVPHLKPDRQESAQVELLAGDPPHKRCVSVVSLQDVELSGAHSYSTSEPAGGARVACRLWRARNSHMGKWHFGSEPANDAQHSFATWFANLG